ncbi:hypothetical protein AAJ76_960006049 [Vairimorpha ceranae]|uniref:Uncharacterized protein n=1 Tax=Vairimorpha ceranae TaxID=40302 RepID=A0A0F9WME4_9MICR|nr:hypothetical protein AAJ76_960006049 [Vairimorpha ceranae]KKO74233.1 hypothetical protein AAJ76_960006049 [Vairimorpha ceranae]
MISRKNLNWNSVLQIEIKQFNNQQPTNLDIFMYFCKYVLVNFKSAFDKIKNEQLSISEEIY